MMARIANTWAAMPRALAPTMLWPGAVLWLPRLAGHKGWAKLRG